MMASEPWRLMSPLDAIKADPPNVWITYFDGFDPGVWGFVGTTQERQRTTFLKRSQPGVLVVAVGSFYAKADERQRVIGLLQCSHETGHASDYMPPAAYAEKEATERSKGSWNHAVRVVRGWRVLPHSRMTIQDFASTTYTTERARYIGSAGMQLQAEEARRILELDLEEVDIYGQPPVGVSTPGTAEELLAPSRPGPISKTPCDLPEAEGPKHLYVLALSGKPGVFLNDPSARGRIVKVGFSKAPETRMAVHNCHLPIGPFQWSVYRSTEAEGRAPFAGSKQGLAGEEAMKNILDAEGRSLGREFFLAEDGMIEKAWNAGIQAGADA